MPRDYEIIRRTLVESARRIDPRCEIMQRKSVPGRFYHACSFIYIYFFFLRARNIDFVRSISRTIA